MNKYIKTKDNSILKVYADRGTIIECVDNENKKRLIIIDKKDIIKEANTINELNNKNIKISG